MNILARASAFSCTISQMQPYLQVRIHNFKTFRHSRRRPDTTKTHFPTHKNRHWKTLLRQLTIRKVHIMLKLMLKQLPEFALLLGFLTILGIVCFAIPTPY